MDFGPPLAGPSRELLPHGAGPPSSSARAHGTLRFHAAAELDAATLSAVQRRIRIRVLRIAVRHGILTPEVAADLARWGHGGGLSLQAGVLIEAADRSGLKRLLRYCARPAFASERLSWEGHEQPVRYTLPKPLPTGQTELTLTLLELLDRLAALIPPATMAAPSLLRRVRPAGRALRSHAPARFALLGPA